VGLATSSTALVGVKNGRGQLTSNAAPRDHVHQASPASIKLSSLDESAMLPSTHHGRKVEECQKSGSEQPFLTVALHHQKSGFHTVPDLNACHCTSQMCVLHPDLGKVHVSINWKRSQSCGISLEQEPGAAFTRLNCPTEDIVSFYFFFPADHDLPTCLANMP
jgi:hypothetical protein